MSGGPGSGTPRPGPPVGLEESAPVRLLMIDNYDSFTYNLVQYLGELGAQLEVVRNDVEDVASLLRRNSEGVVISPGPGTPRDAGVSVAAVAALRSTGLPCWGCVWVTSRSVRPLAATSFELVPSCTARPHASSTTGPGS